MPARPQNPQSPVPPASHPHGTVEPGTRPTGVSSRHPDDESGDEENPPDFHETAQPPEEDRVMEDMATLAVNPGVLEHPLPSAAIHGLPQGSAHFHELEDSAIMLELRAGNMAGFDRSEERRVGK